MEQSTHARLAEWTTLGLGGPADSFVIADSEADLIELVRTSDRAQTPLLVLGGGSNLVVADDGFRGTAVKVSTRGVHVSKNGERVRVTVAAGESWDGFVERAVSESWRGIECLSGIPGLVGATPMQNVGAYGQDVSQTIAEVRCFDRADQTIVRLKGDECGFAYRSSRFRGSARYVIVEVTFDFLCGPRSMPIAYAELSKALSVPEGAEAPLANVRNTVIALRRGKGMVADAADPESKSAGSFFTNPIVSADVLREVRSHVARELGSDAKIPLFPERDGRTKISAAWLIENAGFQKGSGGSIGISKKHALAIVNRGGTTADLIAFARSIRERVHARFGVTLEPEPIFVGATL